MGLGFLGTVLGEVPLLPATRLSLRTLLAASLGAVVVLVIGLLVATVLQLLRSHSEALLVLQAALLGLIVVVVGGVFVVVTRIALRPLEQLTEVTRKLAGGDHEQRAELRAVAELEQLADDFNTIAATTTRKTGMDALPEWQRAWIASAFERREEARREAERAEREQAEFLANMSHELRTPLNAVVGMTTLLAGTRLSGDQEQYVDVVRSSGEHMVAIVNDVLDYSKIEAGAIELEHIPFALHRAGEETLALVADQAARKGVELHYVEQGELPDAIVGDLARLRQVLLNLLSNAVKFTEEGSVSLTVAAEGPERVRFTVRDSGIGIPRERLQRLFQRFVQADVATPRTHGGTGLGLVISKGLVELMGGSIAVASEPGVGSRFSFAIAAPPAELPPEELSDPPSGALAGRRALVVAPEAADRGPLERLLRRWGMDVEACGDAAEARIALAAGTGFEVALVDQETEGAVRLARDLSDTAGVSPVLLCSSSDATDTQAFVAAVRKPLRRQALSRTILGLIAPDRLPSREPVLDATLGRERPLRILVAEDSSANQLVLRAMLGRLGYQPDVVGDGAEAIEAVQRQSYDVVLMDSQMPRVDGIAATREIHARLPPERRPAIIGISATADERKLREAAEAGMVGRIPKPVVAERLVDALRSVRPLSADEPPAAGATGAVGAGALEERMGGDQFERVVGMFLEGGHETLAEMSDAARRDDGAGVARAAHQLLGSTLLFEARPLSDHLRRTEHAGRHGDSDLASLVDRAAELFSAVERELTQRLQRRATARGSGP